MTSRTEKRALLVKRLAELAPRHQLDAMLEEVDGRVLVRSIPAEDVYGAIIDVGLADSTEIVQLASPEQFRTWVDLAAWQRDRLDPLEVVHWLRAARGDDDEAFVAKLRSLDIEVLELVYKKLVTIHDLEEDPDANPAGVTMETPEGKFLVEFRVDGVDEAALRRLTFDLMAHNPFELARFLEAVRWELETEIEETAYQFRQARLQDLGFPPADEAARVFAWADPDKAEASGGAAGLVTPSGRVDYVAAALQGLSAVERQNLEAEVRYLVNCVLVAEGAEPGDPPAVRRFSERARDYLDLGLEHVTGGDPARCGDAVRERTLKEIFQLGFSLTLRLKRKVERLAQAPGAKFGETWLALDDETRAVQALLLRRPLKALKVPGAEPVPFRSRRELQEAEALLERIKVQGQVLSGLLGTSPVEAVARFGVNLAELTPQRLFAAVVARAEIDGVVEVSPFPPLRVQELCARLFTDSVPVALRESAGKRAVATLSASLAEVGPELELMVRRVLEAWRDDFGTAWAKDARVEAKKILSLPVAGEVVV